jgi:2,5-diketo-D-gluconate reductase A
LPILRIGKMQDMTTQSSSDTHVELIDGRSMPRVGFGVFQIPPRETLEAVKHALRTGYRLVDTAAAYGNEAEVGQAIRESELEREDVFVTTKLWNGDHGRESAHRAFENSLGRLRFDYVDLYLIHWPVPMKGLYVETWQALTEIQASGRARSVGVSNFEIDHLQRIIDETGTVPAVNQIELHPRLQQRELRRYHAEHRIVTEAYSPLAQGEVLEEDAIAELASRHGKTPAQVVLRWHLQLGNMVIPKSVNKRRIEENLDIFDFELDDEAMRTIESLDRGERVGADPNTFALGA